MKKLRFVLNAKNLETAAARVCISGVHQLLKSNGYDATLNDWSDYSRYDVAIVISPDATEKELAKIRQSKPGILIGIADPKTSRMKQAAEADFLMVSSVEQEDLFLRYNPNVFSYFMFPEVKATSKKHANRDKIIIGYHGNKVHLHSMYHSVVPALEALGKTRPIEFWALYDRKGLGDWKVGLPDPALCPVRHVQWTVAARDELIPQMDIGIVPNSMPIQNMKRRRGEKSFFARVFLEDPNDYWLRFKYSSNPGRIYVFAQHDIPVISDFFPSAAQFLEHGRRGFLAHSAVGWQAALQRLADHPDLRQSFASSLRTYIDEGYSRERIFQEFMQFLSRVVAGRSDRTRGPAAAVEEKSAGLQLKWQMFEEALLRPLKNRLGARK